MGKFTPAPWDWNSDKFGKFHKLESPAGTVVRAEFEENLIVSEEDKALIAAAPELYEALKAAMRIEQLVPSTKSVDSTTEVPAVTTTSRTPTLKPRKALTRKEINKDLDKVFGKGRTDRLSVDSTTEVLHHGGEAGIGITVGISEHDLWINRPRLSKSGPCKICKPQCY